VKLTPIQLGQQAADVERIAGLTACSRTGSLAVAMNIAISLAQFIMLALAVMASNILVNSGAVTTPPADWSAALTLFVAAQGLWLLVIPAGWLLFAGWCDKSRSPLARIAQPLGVAITVGVLLVIVLVLAF